jgi:fructose-1,6-bisphosphatase/inositol monophosphatase family enzyme
MRVSGLRDQVLNVMRDALRFAESHLLLGEIPLDAETTGPFNLPFDCKEELKAWVGDPSFTQENHDPQFGLPPSDADRETHNLMTRTLRRAFPDCHIVGQGAHEDEWALAEQASPGSIIFSVDAIDGSLPYDTLTFGYSTNVLAFQRTSPAQTQLLLSAVANSSHFVAVYEDPGTVSVGSLRGGPPDDKDKPPELKSVTEPSRNDMRDGTVALVAAQAKHRHGASERLWADAGLTIFTTGGAPAAIGLILGRLDALVTSEAQTTHDAAYLPILAALGIPILAETTSGPRMLGLPDVLNFFSHVAISARDRLAHPVPRFVAARTPKQAGMLSSYYFSPRP